ncbi:MAG: hypothetical protein J1F33_01180 [Clostridiales bacterium]|nr:hypothetical protein [Clostridiales bacterium]
MLRIIEQLLPYYKSFNQLANDALRLGLPLLLESKLDTTIRLEENHPDPRPQKIMTVPDERIELMIRLMQEIVMNTTISKSLICSLFNAKNKELQEQVVSPRNFECGYMRDTPNFMMKYEVDMLNAMDDDD